MYANSYGAAGHNTLEFSNNPFISDPSNPHSRFPDISDSTLSPPQSPQQYQTGYYTGYGADPAQYQMQQPQYQQFQTQLYPGQLQSQPQMPNQTAQFASTSYASQYPTSSMPGQMMSQPTGYPLQSSTSFGEQGQAQPGYSHQQYNLPPGYQSQQYSGYQGYSQQQTSPSYLAEFDPYAQRPQPQAAPQNTTGAAANSGSGNHPRDYIRMHKAELEAWNSPTWTRLLSSCDALKAAWLARKQQAEGIVQQLGGNTAPGLFGPDPGFGYNDQVEGWKRLLKDANDSFDTVAACTFQLQEIFKSYRQSGDAVSKRRVRESCNAAVKALPDWPTPLN
ncbi:hypothetical protein F5I97DRAFT_1929565 [Phlebopus sp. FC_14]|nr:hypothetical protein F5I97DRAFT_1929565 [Phlebopus sp. FC_14]